MIEQLAGTMAENISGCKVCGMAEVAQSAMPTPSTLQAMGTLNAGAENDKPVPGNIPGASKGNEIS